MLTSDEPNKKYNDAKVELEHADSEINCLEESVLRMRYGIAGHIEAETELATYERKPVNDAVYKKLLELELRAFEMTGRLEPMLKKHKARKKRQQI
ncbi:MAG: hypothetical protein O2897_03665 [bacterium]|nr:hypothetical protein [bacterium]